MHDDDERGKIKNLARYKQSKLISYEGMKRKRNVTPTDIDGFIDYNGVAFVYIDGKLEDKEIDYGQKLAYEHAVDSHSSAGHAACAMIFRHNEPPENIIMAKDKYVSEIYYNKKWNPINGSHTLLECIEQWEKSCTDKGIIL